MKTYPILRLTVFLSAGIFFAEAFPEFAPLWILGSLALILLVGMGFFLRKSSYALRGAFGISASLFMFLIGAMLAIHAYREVKVSWSEQRQAYSGIIQETPIPKKKSMQCPVRVNGKTILLYLAKDSVSTALQSGEKLLFYTQIRPPQNTTDFQEFDYASYLLHKGISGTAYAGTGFWKKQQGEPELTWKQKALLVRERLVDKFRELGADEEHLPVLSALTIGYKVELEHEVRDMYAVAGISHVLALSGMHIGIIWMLLEFLLRPLGITKTTRWLRWLLSTTLLWTFAFVVGLEASVVRAVVMCMLMGLARVAGSKALSVNTLAIAALLMLMYRPFYLFDVGFQLSFVAVASICLFYPILYRCLPVKNVILRGIWSTTTVSIVAQMGTAPLVMYYFSNFSVYFLLANLFAALLVPLIIYGAVLVFVLIPFPTLAGWGMWVLNHLVEGLTFVARWTSGLPYATFSFSRFSIIEIALFYALLLQLFSFVQKRSRRKFIGLLIWVVCLLLARLCALWGWIS